MNKKETIKRKNERELKNHLKKRGSNLEALRSEFCTNNSNKLPTEPIKQPMNILYEVNSFSSPKRNKINPIFLRYLL
jgi:hypothetical protein